MRRSIYTISIIATFALAAAAQLSLPRESQRQEISQVVGDGKISIVYHRPNVKGRKVWGSLVPYGQVWRTGANENTTIEVTRDSTINGQNLPAGKYGFHAIPNQKDWTLIFSKVNDAWGSFTYDQKNDALRVTIVPVKTKELQESLMYEFDSVTANSATVALSWEKVRVPFTIDFGDVKGRMLAQIDAAIKARKADDMRPLNQGANYVLTFKIADRYNDALGWLGTSIAARETFGNVGTKARILAEMGRITEAIALGEKSVALGKASTPPASAIAIGVLEDEIAKWKAKK